MIESRKCSKIKRLGQIKGTEELPKRSSNSQKWNNFCNKINEVVFHYNPRIKLISVSSCY